MRPDRRTMPVRFAVALVGLILGACGAPGPATPDAAPDAGPDAACVPPLVPVLPPADDGFLLGLAGVPQGTFGPETAPGFAAPFAGLVADGFNRYLPLFLTSESGEGTTETTYFLPPEITGAPEAASCTGPRNPWLEAPPGMGLVLPMYLLVLDVPSSEPLDASLVADRVSAFVEACLGGDPARLATAYLHDEPANGYAASRLDADPTNDLVLANVAALAAGTRAVVNAPMLMVEAPLPRFLPYLGLPSDLEAQLLTDFAVGVQATAPLADLYGFDFYAVDLTEDLSVLGAIVDDARAAAPDAQPVAVLQGFGFTDMEMDMSPATGRRPTPDEVRAGAFAALVRGAAGLFWYGQSALALGDPDPTLWAALRATARDLRRLSGVLALPRVAIDLGNPAVLSAAHADGAAAWILAVNPTAQVQPITLDPGDRLADGLTGEPVDLPGGTRTLAPYEVITWWRAACQ